MFHKPVLIITYGFPPHIKSLGGAIRMLKLAEFLQKNSCDVHVLCVRTAHFDTFGYDELLNSLAITYVDDPAAQAASRAFNRPENNETIFGRSKAVIKSHLKCFVIDTLTPDTAVTMIGCMRRAACSIVSDNPDMTIITSGPPHSVHLVGRWLKNQFSETQWIVDYRDSWNGTSLFRKRNRVLQKLNEFLERRVLAECDCLTYISSPMLKKLQQLFGSPLAAKAYLITNGFDNMILSVFRNFSRENGPLRLGYFGAIDDGKNSYRNPECIFEAMVQRPELELRLEFYGSIKISSVWQNALGERLVVGSQLSHHEALEKMATMDALLILHTREDGADEVVTGKVFEYIASGLPIVSIGPKNMAVNSLLADDASAFCAKHTDQDEIARLLSHLVATKAMGAMPVRDRRQLAVFSREYQYALFLKLINEHKGEG